MEITLNSKVADMYAHPVGRDIVDKLLLQLNKPAWLISNPLVGNLKLKFIQKLIKKQVTPNFLNTLLGLLNSEPDVPSETAVQTAPKWWKEAVFYQIYPRSFCEGGLLGIISKLDYLHDLGIDALWMSPVYDSPNDDNGYDIRDYYKIQPEFGTMEDMDQLIAELKKRGMKLVMDLVVNHTSDEHPWFQQALCSENAPYREFYHFVQGNKVNNWTSFFGGSAWNYYPEQDVSALHLFSKKQMDLNWECAKMRQEIYKMVRWWLEKGVDGFRLDVINYISKQPGLPEGDAFIGTLMGYTGIEHYFYGPRLHNHLKELKREAFEPFGAFTVGETPGVGTQMGRLLTDGYRKELDLIFSFDHLETPGYSRFDDYQYDLTYLKKFYITHLNDDKGHGWNTLFFNNHDNPRMVSKIDPSGRYTDQIARLLAVLQLTLRGTPFLFQGDETGVCNVPFRSMDEIKDVESIGMYEELLKTVTPDEAFKRILAGTRDHARAPICWEDNESQRGRSDSIWRFYQDLISLRKSSRSLVYGELSFLRQKDKNLFCYTRTLDGECFYIEVNLGVKTHKSHALKEAKLVIGNYKETSDMLQAYEARVYTY